MFLLELLHDDHVAYALILYAGWRFLDSAAGHDFLANLMFRVHGVIASVL